jgi:hypothetical protein
MVPLSATLIDGGCPDILDAVQELTTARQSRRLHKKHAGIIGVMLRA